MTRLAASSKVKYADGEPTGRSILSRTAPARPGGIGTFVGSPPRLDVCRRFLWDFELPRAYIGGSPIL